MAKALNQGFRNVLSYAAGMETWVKNNYPQEMNYTFAQDFAIADWMTGEQGVLETYSKVKEEWLRNYKAFTEAVVSINMLAWAHDQLKRQGFDGRDKFIKLYSELYHQGVQDFYEKYEGDKEKCQYFFEMTD